MQDIPGISGELQFVFPSPAHTMDTGGHLQRDMYTVHRLRGEEIW